MAYDEKRKEYIHNHRSWFAYYGAQHRDKIKQEMVEAYGGKCVDCEETDPVVLSLDHIYDDAHVEIALYGKNKRGGHHHYERLKREGWPKERFQLLCFNCNARKEHKRRRAGVTERLEADEPANRAKTKSGLSAPVHNTSGLKGIFWNSQKGKWNAHLMVDYKRIHIGFFDDIRDAAVAYTAKVREVWGPDAWVPSEEEIEAAVKLNTNLNATVNSDELGL